MRIGVLLVLVQVLGCVGRQTIPPTLAAYVRGDCAGVRQLTEQGDPTLSAARRDLLRAFCEERDGDGPRALGSYRTVLERHRGLAEAREASLRIAHLAVVEGPEGAGASSQAKPRPIDRKLHKYPPYLQALSLEGWVHLRFTVQADGTTSNIRVADSDPPYLFDLAAVEAVGTWLYEPVVEDGEAVDRPGVEIVLSFEMEKNFWGF